MQHSFLFSFFMLYAVQLPGYGFLSKTEMEVLLNRKALSEDGSFRDGCIVTLCVIPMT